MRDNDMRYRIEIVCAGDSVGQDDTEQRSD